MRGNEDLTAMPLIDRKARLAKLLIGAPSSLQYSDHQIGRGPDFHRLACQRGLEGIVSKRVNGRYEPDRRSWLKVKCLNREEFVVVGWTTPKAAGIGSGRCCWATTRRMENDLRRPRRHRDVRRRA